jgi:hypothetical protein
MTIRGYARDAHQEWLLLDAGAEKVHREKHPSARAAMVRLLLNVRHGDLVLVPRGVDLPERVLEDLKHRGVEVRLIG